MVGRYRTYGWRKEGLPCTSQRCSWKFRLGALVTVLFPVKTRSECSDGALTEIWTSPPYNHCMFTARPDFEPELEQRFAEALSGMSYDNPSHRAVLEAEGLRRWVEPELDGYISLREASWKQGFFKRN